MDDLVGTLRSLLRGMEPVEKTELIRIAGPAIRQIWLPNPGPQTEAYLSAADLLLYGGAAGGGKSSLLLGLALTRHQDSVIFRRAYADLPGLEKDLLKINKGRDGFTASPHPVYRKGKVHLEFGALEKPGAEMSWQGRRHDFYGFDEGAQISRDKIFFILGWLASTDRSQRSRAVIASNPPIGGEGDWMLTEFGPWLDPMFDNPAKPGELRWSIVVGETTLWVAGPGSYKNDGTIYERGEWQEGMDRYTALSRSFIPALLDDNPFLKDTDYRSRIENMREPLRSQLLYGDFLAGREDHAWQVIPSQWIRDAQDRWREAPAEYRPMITLATDVALGGGDQIASASLHSGNWFGTIQHMARSTDDPWEIAAWMVKLQRDGADLSVDATGGYGSGVKSHLRVQHKMECAGLVFSAKAPGKSKDGKHEFYNLRAKMWWQFAEALSPDSGEAIKLPPDPRLLAQLTAPHYEVRGSDIIIESKEVIRKRLGSSTDDADAVIMAWYRRTFAIRKDRTAVAGLPPVPKIPNYPVFTPDAWMNNQ